MKILKPIAFGLLFTAPAYAYVADGHSYSATCNANGYVLTSDHPVSRFIEAGVASKMVEGIEKLYLGKSCDAFHKIYGQGSWCWANGGFLVSFDSKSFGFPRQELSCQSAEISSFDDGCRC